MEEEQVAQPVTLGALWDGYYEACVKGTSLDGPEMLQILRGCFYSSAIGVVGLLDFIAQLDEAGEAEMASAMMESIEQEIETALIGDDSAQTRDH